MLRFRSFRNADPPLLAELWRSRNQELGFFPIVSPDIFEFLVFSKLYFEPAGLILAFDDDRPVGFAHASFGPNETESDVAYEMGTTNLLVVHPDADVAVVADGLLEQCEQYLRSRGAKVLYGGGIKPLNGFYLGLYGGSELPGILATDEVTRKAFAARGYREIEKTVGIQLNLAQFEAKIDRRQMLIRRQMVVEPTTDAPTQTWWDACTLGPFDLTQYLLVQRDSGMKIAKATFRNMDPLAPSIECRATGLIELFIEQDRRRQGLATFILSEAFRQFQRQGIATVEARTLETNAAALEMYKKLGFQRITDGIVYRKDGG